LKRYGNLYSKITKYSNIELAHDNAQKGKRHYTGVQKVNKNQDFYLKKIQRMLINKTFQNSEYTTFIKRGKKDRLIFRLPYFPDRIVQHAIMNIVEPIWKKTLIRDTYSAIKDRGIHDGVKRIKRFLKDKENTKYCLKLDVKKFYPSIDHNILKQIIRRKIKCKDTLNLLYNIIESADGIPIGNYLSQYFGNLYLSTLDHFVKENKKVKYYTRYCDDIVIFHKDKKYLHKLKFDIFKFFDALKIKPKENYQIFPVSNGVDFLGYVFTHDKTKIRKSIKLDFQKKVKDIKQHWQKIPYTKIVNTTMSYYGWFQYADATNLWNKYINHDMHMIFSFHCKKNKIHNPLDCHR
jgi:hypothetical protein